MGRHLTSTSNQSHPQGSARPCVGRSIGTRKTTPGRHLRTLWITGACGSPPHPSAERPATQRARGAAQVGADHGCPPTQNPRHLSEMSQRHSRGTGRWTPPTRMKNNGERRVRKPTSVVRRGAGGKGLLTQYLACCLPYFVLFHSDKAILEQAAARLTEWLRDMGLELKPSKTKVTHTVTPLDGNVGVDYIAINIRQF